MELALGGLLSGHCVRALAHTFHFLLRRNEGSEKGELGLWMPRPTTSHQLSIELFDFLFISSISTIHIQEETDRIYTLVMITAFSICWST